ncbi:MAG: site-specific integrase, partial [Ruminococcus sp.]|nr:site-specific integrase [Candidatus Copronaster equi]
IEEDREMNIINENSYLRKLESKKRIEASPLAKACVQSVTRNQIDDFLKSITHYSDSVIKKEFEMLSRCFREAVNRDIIIKNPMLNVRRPKSKKKQQKTRALTLGEQKKLLEILKSEEVNYSAQTQLMMLTGMRMGEINALDVNDVNFDFKIINIRRSMTRDENSKPIIGETTKTYAGMRKIPLTDEAAKVLKEYIQNDFVPNYENLLFWNTKQNTPLTTSSVNCQLSRVFEKFDIIDETVSGKVSLHSLRHTYATRCIEAGMSAKVLQHLLGHTDIKVTLNTYCDAFSEFQENDVAKFTSYMQEKMSI